MVIRASEAAQLQSPLADMVRHTFRAPSQMSLYWLGNLRDECVAMCRQRGKGCHLQTGLFYVDPAAIKNLQAMECDYPNMFVRLWQTAAATLPSNLRFVLRRANFSRQIRRGRFRSEEPEWLGVTRQLRAGDWAIDVGANVGHYTCHMARCVGPSGRVLAIEPIATSFALLTANVRSAGLTNVTLLNIALSSAAALGRMTVPAYAHTRLDDYYRAHLSADGDFAVLCLPLDAIPIPGKVRLVKIDAEGHDLQVLLGMQSLLQRDQPTVVVEGWTGGAPAEWLTERGYSVARAAGSPNIVATPRAATP